MIPALAMAVEKNGLPLSPTIRKLPKGDRMLVSPNEWGLSSDPLYLRKVRRI